MSRRNERKEVDLRCLDVTLIIYTRLYPAAVGHVKAILLFTRQLKPGAELLSAQYSNS